MKTDKQEPELMLVASPARRERPGTAADGQRELTLAGLWRTFRRGIWLVALVSLMTVLVTAAVLKLEGPSYEATMTVAPAARDLTSAGRIAAELEQYAGLAALGRTAGVIEPVSTLDRYLALLSSTRVGERLAADRAVMLSLFGDQWDASTETWVPPDGGLLAGAQRAILEFFGFPAWQPPDPALLAEFLDSRLEIIGTSGIYRLVLEDDDPARAVQLLSAMHAGADSIMREDALATVRDQIDEIEAVLAGSGEPARQDALEALLAGHYQTEALLQAAQSYATEVISPPSTSGRPSSLHPLVVLALAAIVGLIIGLFVVFLRDALRARP